jgi:hypothetical protein
MAGTRWDGIFTFAAAAAIALPLPALAAPAEGGSGAKAGQGCWYYSEANFQGTRAEIVGGGAPAALGDEWNDKISSLTCHPLCTLVAFDQADQTGTQKRFTGDVRYVGDAWNDKISAVSVTCRRRVRSIS